MNRPSVNIRCVADAYANKSCERIIEFSSPGGKGGLISVRQNDDGTVTVTAYRLDAGVTVAADTAH